MESTTSRTNCGNALTPSGVPQNPRWGNPTRTCLATAVGLGADPDDDNTMPAGLEVAGET